MIKGIATRNRYRMAYWWYSVKALSLDLLGETGEKRGGVLMAGSIGVMWIRDGGHLAAYSVTALNVMWLFVKS
jgi:hypothetical protein